jgi:hypothetical protein
LLLNVSRAFAVGLSEQDSTNSSLACAKASVENDVVSLSAIECQKAINQRIDVIYSKQKIDEIMSMAQLLWYDYIKRFTSSE